MPTILLADDHRIVRAGLRLMLAELEDCEVVGEASDGHEAVALAAELQPDLVVADVSMPGMDGIALTRALRDAEAPPRVLVLSMHTERHFVLNAFAAGASGYLVKSASREQLGVAVRSVLSDKRYISPEVTGVLLEEVARSGEGPAHRLTQRERQVLRLVSEGLNAKEAAAELGISAKTVHAFRSRIMHKLDIHSVAELTKYAIRFGITSL